MLFVTLILWPLFILYIFIRACQEEKEMKRKEKERREKWERDHPTPHIPGYRRL